MTNTELADELMAKLPKWISSGGPGTWHETLTGAQWGQIIAALRAERPQSGEMVMPCSITVGAARFGGGVKVETVQAAINRTFVRLQNAEHIEGKLRELLVGTLPFFELLEKIRLAAAEAERGKT